MAIFTHASLHWASSNPWDKVSCSFSRRNHHPMVSPRTDRAGPPLSHTLQCKKLTRPCTQVARVVGLATAFPEQNFRYPRLSAVGFHLSEIFAPL